MSIVACWDFMYFFLIVAVSLVTGEENDYICYAWCG